MGTVAVVCMVRSRFHCGSYALATSYDCRPLPSNNTSIVLLSANESHSYNCRPLPSNNTSVILLSANESQLSVDTELVKTRHVSQANQTCKMPANSFYWDCCRNHLTTQQQTTDLHHSKCTTKCYQLHRVQTRRLTWVWYIINDIFICSRVWFNVPLYTV